jgi:aspartate racemase
MKTVGIIGGVGPESTMEYYRLIIAAYRDQHSGTSVPPVNNDAQDPGARSYPSIIINSVDLTKLLRWIRANELEAFTDYLAGEIERLARAGADFGALASNTPHLVFDELRRRSPIPLISIVDSTCDAAQALGLKRVGLFGTRFTMQARFYPDVFSKAGITIVVPQEEEQAYIHEKYMQELLNNIFLPETRQRLLAIVERMKAQDNVEALILGGTELPLILRDPECHGIPVLDTTKMHVKRIVAELLS